jgi:hypothetical protein
MGEIPLNKKTGTILLFSALALSVLLFYFFKGTLTTIFDKDLVRFIIGISSTLSGLGIIALQLDYKNGLVRDLLNYSIIMIASAIFGFLFLFYPSKIFILGINFGTISGFLLCWGLVSILGILIEKKLTN